MRLLVITLLAWAIPSPAAAQDTELACVLMRGDRAEAAARTSPLDSVSFVVGGAPVKICYGRPSARERVIFGGLLPYDELWRTGANEPTMLHTSVPLSIAGIEVAPGSYSLYTVPGEEEWQVVVNASTSQWGHERYYTGEVAAGEIGRATVESTATEELVETFTIRAEPLGDGAVVVLEWENTRVRVPVRPAG
jgi:hypothetical protein